MPIWPVHEAKARFSEFLDTCLRDGPQVVSRRGTEAAVLVPINQWRKLQALGQPTRKDLLLSDTARADLDIPPRGRRRRRVPEGVGCPRVSAGYQRRFGTAQAPSASGCCRLATRRARWHFLACCADHRRAAGRGGGDTNARRREGKENRVVDRPGRCHVERLADGCARHARLGSADGRTIR